MFINSPKETAKVRNRHDRVINSVLHWIVDTDRKFRMAQGRIDRFGDRF